MNLHGIYPRGDHRNNMHFQGVGEAVAAGLYVVSNIYSWSEAKKMPGLQAKANKEVLELQKQHYDAISAQQRAILNASIGDYMANIDSILNDGSFEEAFPDVPIAAEYIPVDACCIQGSTVECNIDKVPRADDYVRYINRLHEQNDLIHALAMDSRFLVTLDIQSQSVQDLSRGLLPIGDVVEVLTDNAEMSCLTGRIGSSRRTTARDLGISKLRAQTAGRAEFRASVSWFNTSVSPLQRQHDIGSMMQTPTQRITLALHQSQLIQESLQNKNNALAQKAPYLMGELQARISQIITKLQMKANEALLVNTHVPNYAATIMPNTSNISGLVGSIGQAVEKANISHFFGPPAMSQDGYMGSGSTKDVASSRSASDRPNI